MQLKKSNLNSYLGKKLKFGIELNLGKLVLASDDFDLGSEQSREIEFMQREFWSVGSVGSGSEKGECK